MSGIDAGLNLFNICFIKNGKHLMQYSITRKACLLLERSFPGCMGASIMKSKHLVIIALLKRYVSILIVSSYILVCCGFFWYLTN